MLIATKSFYYLPDNFVKIRKNTHRIYVYSPIINKYKCLFWVTFFLLKKIHTFKNVLQAFREKEFRNFSAWPNERKVKLNMKIFNIYIFFIIYISI